MSRSRPGMSGMPLTGPGWTWRRAAASAAAAELTAAAVLTGAGTAAARPSGRVPAPAGPEQVRRADSDKAALLAAGLAFFIIVLDITVVSVALPTIGRELHGGLAGLQWIVGGYVVVFSALLLSSGTLSDRVGASRALAAGFIGFTLASAACGLAPALAFLLAARVVQGAAAAAMLPASLALVRQAFPDPKKLARAIAIWTAAGGAAVAAGPVIGGLLTGTIGWRAIFFVNVPAGLLGVIALSRVTPSPRRPARFDLPGQIAAITTVAALAIGVIEGGHRGFGSPVALVSLTVFALAAVAFVAVERRVAVPMVPLGIFRDKTVSSTTVAGLIVSFAFYGQVFVLSLYFQQALGHSPTVAGLMFIPMTALVAGVNLLAGRLVQRHGARSPLVAGLLVFAGGLLGCLAFGRGTPIVVIELLLIPIGIGAGLTVPPLTTAFMDDIGTRQAGVGAGVFNSSRQLGSALGVAVVGALLDADFVTGLHISFLLSAALVLAAAVLTLRYVRPGRVRTLR